MWLLRRRSLRQAHRNRVAKVFCCWRMRSGCAHPGRLGAGTEGLWRAAAIHKQMKVMAGDAGTPIPGWGPGPSRETRCPESCKFSWPQANSLVLCRRECGSPGEWAPPPFLPPESSVLASGLNSPLLAFSSPETYFGGWKINMKMSKFYWEKNTSLYKYSSWISLGIAST